MKNLTFLHFPLLAILFMVLCSQRCVEVTEFAAPNTVTPGQPFQVKARVKSLLDEEQNFPLQFFLSYDPLYNIEDQPLGEVPVQTLGAYEYRDKTMNITLGSNWFSGRYYLLAKASDGMMYREVQVNGMLNSGADYVPTHLFTWGSTKPGTEFRFSFTLQNVGTLPAGTGKVRCYLSTDPFVGPGDQAVHEIAVNNPLAAGDRREFTAWFNMPQILASGDYYFIVAADANNAVNETVELNNFISQPINVEDQLAETPSEERSAQASEPSPSSLSLMTSVTVMPNPVTDFAQVTFSLNKSAATRVEVYDQLGRLVEKTQTQYSEPGDYQMSVDLRDLPDGVYIACVMVGDEKSIAKKVVVQR